ncbi:Cytochrome P450 [Rhynchospora pubera]|uniref:Cytochrome P450 n=1 Tax=Rhynchospora pubera TaxID=906938 RepID=A0AAV8FLV8_9POAL|nr:Cytochrome P450 [Rhynchospora pubera]
MTKSMANCAQSMVEKWTDIITKAETERNQPVEMEVSSHFLEMTADVISHTAFGSNYMKGKGVILAQKEQQMLLFKSLLKVPFPGYKEEVIRECAHDVPTGDVLNKLKLVNMVLLEALRLYGPVVNLRRQALQDLELGDLKVPKGTVLAIPVAILHRDKELWGPDADKFNPVKFENGVNKAAKQPNALLAFSIGPRSCIGQNFAILEAKIVVSLILQNFSLNISPNYVHAPIELITLQPKFGLPMNIKRLE